MRNVKITIYNTYLIIELDNKHRYIIKKWSSSYWRLNNIIKEYVYRIETIGTNTIVVYLDLNK